MSKFKLNFLTILLVVLCFSSCTMEKRIYSSGYHIEWKNGNRILAKKEFENDKRREQTELNKVVTIEQSEMAGYMVKNTSTTIDQNIIASVDNELIFLAKKETINFTTIQKRDINNQQVTINSSIKSEFKNEIKTFLKNSDEKPKINTIGLISFISAILAFFIIPAILSLFLGAKALRQFKRNPEKNKGKWMAKVGVVVGYIGCAYGILISLAAAIFGGAVWLILGIICLIDIIVSTDILIKNQKITASKSTAVL